MSYINHNFITRLPDKTERIALSKLDIEVCISAECDEQWPAPRWSFVQNKTNQRWLWYIVEKTTRKVLAFVFGRRTNATFRRLIALLPQGLVDRLDTDDWKSYTSIRFTPVHRIGKDLTWRIERKNLDLHTRIKRLARKTICFSKSELMHEAVIGRFINLYFF